MGVAVVVVVVVVVIVVVHCCRQCPLAQLWSSIFFLEAERHFHPVAQLVDRLLGRLGARSARTARGFFPMGVAIPRWTPWPLAGGQGGRQFGRRALSE